MFRLELGGGAVAFENEGEADRVASVQPSELSKRDWPEEVIENIKQYQYRLEHPEPAAPLDVTEFPATVEDDEDADELAEATEELTFGKIEIE
jgi:hypothetical protein